LLSELPSVVPKALETEDGESNGGVCGVLGLLAVAAEQIAWCRAHSTMILADDGSR